MQGRVKRLNQTSTQFLARDLLNEKDWPSRLSFLQHVQQPSPLCDRQNADRSLPTVDEVLESVNGSTVFSKLDVRMRFYQVELAEKSPYSSCQMVSFAANA